MDIDLSAISWTPVEKKLPEPDKAVLLYCDCQNAFQEHIKWQSIKVGHRNSFDNKFYLDDADTSFVEVTHWTELPAAPVDGDKVEEKKTYSEGDMRYCWIWARNYRDFSFEQFIEQEYKPKN